MTNTKQPNDLGPALLLMLFAPLLTEVLPGATRLSSLFVLPIEIFVWGGGALLIRYAVRRWRLGWRGMLCLALAMALAEECIIQQTSLAPLVIKIRGVEYARAGGVNYVYLIWALLYEALFVVFLPIYLVEQLFPSRRERLWISKGGMFVVIFLFLVGSVLAWFTWTQIARVKFFHLPAYTPPTLTIILALLVIVGLIFFAIIGDRSGQDRRGRGLPAPQSGLLFVLGACWIVLLYGLLLVAFGIAPGFPPALAVVGGLVLGASALLLVPRWAADVSWPGRRVLGLVLGIELGELGVSFVGFGGGRDLYFKIVIDGIAVILLLLLARKIFRDRSLP